MLTKTNETLHRMSGENINLKLGHWRMPLLRVLGR
jgi:hypothetical protein